MQVSGCHDLKGLSALQTLTSLECAAEWEEWAAFFRPLHSLSQLTSLLLHPRSVTRGLFSALPPSIESLSLHPQYSCDEIETFDELPQLPNLKRFELLVDKSEKDCRPIIEARIKALKLAAAVSIQ